MGCIEIAVCFHVTREGCRINRNMGCIEMNLGSFSSVSYSINRNMGCIEIALRL